MITNLRDATGETCGAKAANLGALLRAGLPVPDGFVVPFAAHGAARTGPIPRLPDALRREVSAALARMGSPAVAVRSSAANEDTGYASAAGQYATVLAVQDAEAVVDAIRQCRASARSPRVADYWNRAGDDRARAEPEMAVLVQRLIDADVSGVMFTAARPGEPTRIEASWGLGVAVVGGIVTPDAYEVEPNGTVRCTIRKKTTRVDRRGERRAGTLTRDVPEHQQIAPTLHETAAGDLACLGIRVAELLRGAQDIEFAIADATTWLLQARPVTAPLPPESGRDLDSGDAALIGTPGAQGVTTGNARVVRGPGDFGRVQAGDILICEVTDPAWTPLFRIAAGVVTQTGGALSHAAIVAREYRIPAVLGIAHVTELVPDGARVTLNGTTGAVTLH